MTPDFFENEVRRIARLKWPSAATSGGAEMIDRRERDGIFITEECVHLIECTTSQKKEKASEDIKKLFDLSKKYKISHPVHAVKCWFVTKNEPTADQRACLKEWKIPDNIVRVLSFSTLQATLVDSRSYLQGRMLHKFGSATNLKNQTNNSNEIEYIPVALRIQDEESAKTVAELSDYIAGGRRFVFLGEYGVGKSVTLFEIFKVLKNQHEQGKTSHFPIYINLREHQGQTEPAEIIERHARNIGFDSPSQLVRAWKAGYVILLLDGFDEVSSVGLTGAWRRLRDARITSLRGVFNLVEGTPAECGIAIAGRENFFDSPDERSKAMGITPQWKKVHLDGFGDEQIQQLMMAFDINVEIPAWFPSRPLLLSTLFASMIHSGAAIDFTHLNSPALGWDYLLDKITEREAKIEAGVTGDNIRNILELLATIARRMEGGLGPFSSTDIVHAFERVCGYTPSDQALIVLQRLPGLGRGEGAVESERTFIDKEFADACRAGDVVRFCIDPYGDSIEQFSGTQIPLGEIGATIAAHKLSSNGFNAGQLLAAIHASDKIDDPGVIPSDLFHLATEMRIDVKYSLNIRSVSYERMTMDAIEMDLSNCHFSECIIENLELPPDFPVGFCPSFDDCLISTVIGRTGTSDISNEKFRNCEIGKFTGNIDTVDATMALPIPVGTRVVLTILRKLFVQSLSGRKENALYRGLDSESQQYVPSAISLLSQKGLIFVSSRSSERIWLPVRKMRERALAIISSPSTSSDSVILESKKM